MAIVIALLDEKRVNLFSDSRTAVRAFEVGAITKRARHILGEKVTSNHILTWFPANTSHFQGGPINLNELTHFKERGMTFRAYGDSPQPTTLDNKDQPTT